MDDEAHDGMPDGMTAIYSKRAVWGFSIFFTPLVGGILLVQNLRQIGKKRDAYLVLGIAIVLTAITACVVNVPEKPRSGLTNICNFIGGAFLSEVLFKKYIRNPTDYANKKVWKPLIISVLVSIPFFLAAVYTM